MTGVLERQLANGGKSLPDRPARYKGWDGKKRIAASFIKAMEEEPWEFQTSGDVSHFDRKDGETD